MFKPDHERYQGVRPIHIYLLRLLFLLVVVFVGSDAWSALVRHQGEWDAVRAAAVCMWAAYAALSVLGFIQPLKWLPIVLFEICYKILWLVVVAYPLWSADRLSGHPAEAMTHAFVWVVLPIVAVPWGYAYRTYVWPPRARMAAPQA